MKDCSLTVYLAQIIKLSYVNVLVFSAGNLIKSVENEILWYTECSIYKCTVFKEYIFIIIKKFH